MSALSSSRPLQILVGIIGVTLTLLLFVPEPLVELLWMQELGYSDVFWKILGTEVLLFAVVFTIALVFFGGNVYLLFKQIPPLWASQWAEEGEAPEMGGKPLTRQRLRRFAWGFAAVISLLFASGFAGRWDELFRYSSGQAYGMADPIFGIDISFYLLQLPLIQSLQSGLVGLAFLGLLVLVAAYVLIGEIAVQNGRLRVRPSVVKHLAANVIVLLVGWAWGFYLDRFEVLMSGGGAVYGAGYTDVSVTLPALWIMIAATLGLAAIVAYNLVSYQLRLLLYGVALYVVVLVGGLIAAPSIVNQVYVEPNELQLEEPYLEHNIRFTREAYKLDEVQETSYPADTELTMEMIRDNDETIQNVRLWDPRLLIDNYRQLQQIRLYYQFYDVDIDRYMIDGEYRQVMLSARELTQNLPQQADTWYNRHLQYTHGYGAVANLVAQEGEEGTPSFLVQDLPPQGEDVFMVEEPGIYYGEHTSTYNLVNTTAQELDYPSGDENVYTNYAGTGGVLVDSFWKELLFSWYFSDYNILLSENLHDGSRIQYWNRIQERVRRIAPFLRLDGDPYFVLSDQRQYWIQDAYTTARTFPYSEPVGSRLRGTDLNYIRNSVKVVIDAYNGDVTFYVMDTDDPVLSVYTEVFPELFQPLDAMSENLRAHLRYPNDIFEVQVEKYKRYHMTIPQVFYNNEDLWTRPNEQYDGQQRLMEPYYILSRLPDEDELQFLLMTPMTPENRDNMIGWIAAKSDPGKYGEIVVYNLPKERLIYGPNQIESRIDQNTEISRQLSLWDQRGSRVVRGNLIVVPIENSFLYVEPIYLIAEGVQIPQLRRVIASYGNRVAMEITLDDALNELFGQQVAAAPRETTGERIPTPQTGPPDMLLEARDLVEQARSALQDGNFATFGDRFNALEQLLRDNGTRPDTTAAR
jgi:hypothetical protein